MKRDLKKRRKAYIAQFYRGNRLRFLVSVLSTVLVGGINLILAWLIQQITDTASRVPGALGIGTLAWLIAAVVAGIVLFKTMTYLSKPHFLSKAMRQYKDYAFEKLTRKSIASFEQESTAAYLSAFSNDAATVETDYLDNQFTLIYDLPLLAGAVTMMLWYNPILTLVAVAFFVLPIVSTLLAGDRLSKAEKQVSDRNAGLVASLKDSLSGFSVVKSFKAEAAMRDQFAQSNHAVEDAKCRKRRIATTVSMLAGVAGVTAQLGTFLVGAALALRGWNITPGVLLVFVDLTSFVIDPVRELPELWAKRKAALALVDKLADALEANVNDEGADMPAALEEGIRMAHVSFGYEAGNEVLHDISYHFEAGRSYAIVGASGSGKSTLLNLLMAAHGSYEGSIAYDQTELREISARSLYDLVSMIQQQVYVFNASIHDNITMFRAFPEAEVNRAVRQAGLSELIARRGEAYLCGENGSGLSGGEKQRISIARSLLRGSSVLLADEATASLDAQTAHQVSGAILDLEGMTRIVVTHALEESLLKRYNGILVMKNGTIAEKGSFEELMARKGYFYSLYTIAQ